jgi:hypothetical protein
VLWCRCDAPIYGARRYSQRGLLPGQPDGNDYAMKLTLLLGLLASGLGAQQPSPCASASHRQFDFWIGEWEVSDSLNRRLGTNRIERVLGGCVLYESWSGATGARGHSFNAFDPGDNKWHQTWVDNEGTVLMIAGGIINGEMVMDGKRRLADGSQTLERITWTPNADGTIRQLWQSSRDRGMRWTTVFNGLYRRKSR